MSEHTRFESLGCYLPTEVVTTQSLVDRLSQPPTFDIVRFTGIEARHQRGPDEDTLSLCVRAAEDALSRSRYDAADLDVVISGCITRVRGQTEYFLEPAMSLWVKNALGATRALNFDVANACAGMFTGIYLLDSLIRSGAARTGMVVCGECNSAIYETAVREISSPVDEQFASLTVGDAATAVILDGDSRPDDRLEFIDMLTAAEAAYLCLGKPSEQSAGIALYTKNSTLHGNDRLKLWAHVVNASHAARGLQYSEVVYDHWVPHQLGTRFTEKSRMVTEEGLGAALPPPIHVLDRCGNTSSTSHFVALYEALRDGRISPGDRCLFYPAASGVVTGTISAVVSGMGLT